MFKIVSAKEAVGFIKDGDLIANNSFLALSNPEALQDALFERFIETGSPKNLRVYCTGGLGAWDEDRYLDKSVKAGAVREVVASHYNSMPATVKAALANKIEAYCLPLGLLSHAVRAAASGKDWILSEVGVGIFTDPRIDSCALNEISRKEIVKVHTIEGKDYLLFHTPKIDIAFIKGTTVDPNGNISFEKEYLTVDALSMAQATKRNGGKVIVQVEKVSHVFSRPRNVIVPGILVDYVVVCEDPPEVIPYNPALSGDVHVPSTHMDYFVTKIAANKYVKPDTGDRTPDIIGERAARELSPGQIVNIGIGIPENVGRYASRLGILKDIVITVEAGGIGGLPAPGIAFGATIGADMISDQAAQFDFYDGGGLDICFLGGLEADREGNVNVHKLDGNYAGIGGFANIIHATKTIVFCLSFTAKGLIAENKDGRVSIKQEGSIKKFKDKITAISFSAKNAVMRGQKVLYITERCVFELTPAGLKLKEVFPGIDPQTQIYDLLDFSMK